MPSSGCYANLLSARLAEHGRTTAARYDWHMVAPRVLEYYEQVIQERRRQSVMRTWQSADRPRWLHMPRIPVRQKLAPARGAE